MTAAPCSSWICPMRSNSKEILAPPWAHVMTSWLPTAAMRFRDKQPTWFSRSMLHPLQMHAQLSNPTSAKISSPNALNSQPVTSGTDYECKVRSDGKFNVKKTKKKAWPGRTNRLQLWPVPMPPSLLQAPKIRRRTAIPRFRKAIRWAWSPPSTRRALLVPMISMQVCMTSLRSWPSSFRKRMHLAQPSWSKWKRNSHAWKPWAISTHLMRLRLAPRAYRIAKRAQ